MVKVYLIILVLSSLSYQGVEVTPNINPVDVIRMKKLKRVVGERPELVRARFEQNQTLLHYAVGQGDIDAIRFLISEGADVNAKDSSGQTPLHYAVRQKISIVKLLLSSGADVNAIDSSGQTPVYYPAQLDNRKMLQLLIQKGAKVNVKDYYRYTPLHIASMEGRIESVKLLLEAGADANTKAIYGNTPLHIAAKSKYLNVAELLIRQNADLSIRNDRKETPLDITFNQCSYGIRIFACQFGLRPERDNPEVLLKLFLDKGARPDLKMIRTAIKLEDRKLLDMLLEKNLDYIFFMALKNEDVEVVKTLIECGADVNVTDQGGNSPLHIAAFMHNMQLVKLLLSSGADVNAGNSGLRTPIFMAVDKDSEEVIRFLIKNGADINLTDSEKAAPLHYAVRAEKIKNVKLLIRSGSRVNATDKDGNTPLHYAAENCDKNISEVLLNNDALINLENKEGKTPLDIVVDMTFFPNALCQPKFYPIELDGLIEFYLVKGAVPDPGSVIEQGRRKQWRRIFMLLTKNPKMAAWETAIGIVLLIIGFLIMNARALGKKGRRTG